MMRLAALGLCASVASAQDDGNQDLIAQVRQPACKPFRSVALKHRFLRLLRG